MNWGKIISTGLDDTRMTITDHAHRLCYFGSSPIHKAKCGGA
jgi:hypothetical protein